MKAKKPMSLTQPTPSAAEYQAFLSGAPDVRAAAVVTPPPVPEAPPRRGRPAGEPARGKLFRFTADREAQLDALQRRLIGLLVRNVTATEVIMASLDALEGLSDEELRRRLR